MTAASRVLALPGLAAAVLLASGGSCTKLAPPLEGAADAGVPPAPWRPEFEPDEVKLAPAPGVEPVTPAQQALATVLPDALEFPLQGADDVRSWQPGRVVVSAPGTGPKTGNPFGFARRVRSVEVREDRVRVGTEDVGLEDVVTGSFQVTVLGEGAAPAVAVDTAHFSADQLAWMLDRYYSLAGRRGPPAALEGFAPLATNGPGEDAPDESAARPLEGHPISELGTPLVGLGRKIASTPRPEAPRALDPVLSNRLELPPSDLRILPDVTYAKTVEGPLPVQVGVKASAKVNAAATLRHALQVGARIEAPSGSERRRVSAWARVDASLESHLAFTFALDSGVISATPAGSPKLVGDALTARLGNDPAFAADVLGLEQATLVGDADTHAIASWDRTIFRSRPATTTIRVGAVPVVIVTTVQVDLRCALDAAGSAGGTFTLDEASTLAYRAAWTVGDAAPEVTEVRRGRPPELRATATGGGPASVACALVPRVNWMLYDSVGLRTGAEDALSGSLSLTSRCEGTAARPKGDVKAGISGRSAIQAEAIRQPPRTSWSVPRGRANVVALGPDRFSAVPPVAGAGSTATVARGLGACSTACANGTKDGRETDQDCGGGACAPCAQARACEVSSDCAATLSCHEGTCREVGCADGLRSGDESDTDCGGSCTTRCAVGAHCFAATDCASGACSAETRRCVADACADGRRAAGECATDCGGTCPRKCEIGSTCGSATDCASGFTDGTACVASSCQDGVRSADESGVDCGGASTCDRCGARGACTGATDCADGLTCADGACARTPRCDDHFQNGQETDVDCGGDCPTKCGFTARCAGDGDCAGGTCTSGACAGGYVLRVRVIGLSGGTLVLRNNEDDVLTITGDGVHTFSRALAAGGTYAVTVVTQPALATCLVALPTGTGTTGPEPLAVSCLPAQLRVGGRVSGLVGGEFVLRNNGADDASITGNGPFTFATPVPNASPYAVTVRTQPPAQICTVADAAGLVLGADVDTVAVECAPKLFSVGGVVTGLTSGSVGLSNDGQVLVTTAKADGSPVETGRWSVPQGGRYDVSIASQPEGLACLVTRGSGTIEGADVTGIAVDCTPPFTLGGTVSGLTSGSLVLYSGGREVEVTKDGAFVLDPAIATGAAYAVVVKTQPAGQICTLEHASGTVAGANVADVAVTCAPRTYAVGGSVKGLSGGSLVVQLNGADDLTITRASAFSFHTALAFQSDYAVTILTQPANQVCTLAGASGRVGAGAVTTVAVTCTPVRYSLGGAVEGLVAGTSLVLQNGGPELLVVSEDGPFAFTSPLPHGSAYSVTVKTPPEGQTCRVTQGAGTLTAAFTGVGVACTRRTYTVGGTVQGLRGGPLVLDLGGVKATRQVDGAFRFLTPLPFRANYAVTVSRQPPGQSCTVARGEGQVGAENVEDVAVTCVPGLFTVGVRVQGLLSGVLTLRNNGADDLVIEENGTFEFSDPVAHADPYAVTIATQPEWQTCAVAAGAGHVAAADPSLLVTCRPNLAALGGTVAGLTNGTILLTSGTGEELSLTQNGEFRFPEVPYQASYDVQVSDPPAGQACAVAHATGVMPGPGVLDVAVTCEPRSYTVGGRVEGLSSGTVLLQLGDGEPLPVSGSRAFTFPSQVLHRAAYLARVATTAPGFTCTATQASGTIDAANVVNVLITCVGDPFVVGGAVTGLAGGTVVVQLNGAEEKALSANAPFAFTTPVLNGGPYAVTVKTPPAGQSCSVTNGTGTINGANVTVGVACGEVPLQGLHVWFKADALSLANGASVAQWTDSSPNARHATQGNASVQPTFRTNIVNGKPAVRFDGNLRYLVTPGFPLFSAPNAGVTAFVVFQADAVNSQRFLFMQPQTNCQSNLEFGYFGNGSIGAHAGCGIMASTQSAIPAATWAAYTAVFQPSGTKPTNLEIYRNGVAQPVVGSGGGWVAPGSYGTAANKFIIGARDDNNTNGYNSSPTGDIAELLVYGSALTPTQRAQVEAYLVAKYGLNGLVLGPGGARQWTDGYATSCKAYRQPAAPHVYAGATGSGAYTISPTGVPIRVYCDMDHDGGGWTLVNATLPNGGAWSASPGFPEPLVTQAWLATTYVTALATGATQVHIRTSGQAATRAVTSIANTAPIVNLRQGLLANNGLQFQAASNFWTGNLLPNLATNCAVARAWPEVYWACGNAGLHFQSGTTTWVFGQPNEALEAYVR